MTREDPRLRLIRQASDIRRAKESGQMGIILHFQGTEPIENDLNLVHLFKELGVGMIQLAYNVKNRVGDGCEERTDAGLSRFGLKLIRELNQARVVVDCSHTGYRTTMEALEASTRPVVFSHANVKAVHDSPRNIRDDQIKAAAESGGLIGMVGFPAFVSGDPHPTLDQFIDHMDYITDLTGSGDHVALGIDYFQGQAGVMEDDEAQELYRGIVASGRWQPDNYPPPPYRYPQGIDTPRDLPNLTAGLLARGYREEDVKKILGGNWVRVFEEVWGE